MLKQVMGYMSRIFALSLLNSLENMNFLEGFPGYPKGDQRKARRDKGWYRCTVVKAEGYGHSPGVRQKVALLYV